MRTSIDRIPFAYDRALLGRVNTIASAPSDYSAATITSTFKELNKRAWQNAWAGTAMFVLGTAVIFSGIDRELTGGATPLVHLSFIPSTLTAIYGGITFAFGGREFLAGDKIKDYVIKTRTPTLSDFL